MSYKMKMHQNHKFCLMVPPCQCMLPRGNQQKRPSRVELLDRRRGRILARKLHFPPTNTLVALELGKLGGS